MVAVLSVEPSSTTMISPEVDAFWIRGRSVRSDSASLRAGMTIEIFTLGVPSKQSHKQDFALSVPNHTIFSPQGDAENVLVIEGDCSFAGGLSAVYSLQWHMAQVEDGLGGVLGQLLVGIQPIHLLSLGTVSQ